MNYQDVIKNSKFYVPMNLNLCFLLKDREIVVLMNVINCDAICEKLSVRKLMRYTNRSNNKIQDALTELRALKLINGFKPNYEVIKEIFDSLNNAKTIEEKKNWCEVYRKSIQNTVSKNDTENVSKTGTQIKQIEKEDINKKDIEYKTINKKRVEVKKTFPQCEVKQSKSSTVEDVDCDWNTEFIRLEAKMRRSSTVDELNEHINAFSKKAKASKTLPSDFFERLEDTKELRDKLIWNMKAKKCYT